MAFKGQPIPSNLYNIASGKISDGKSVRVKSTGAVAEGNFYLIDGFFGMAIQSATTGQEVVLNIEQAEFETDQIDKTQTFAVGTSIYWNDTKKQFTETDTGNRKVGRVSATKDSNNVIWFILGPQA